MKKNPTPRFRRITRLHSSRPKIGIFRSQDPLRIFPEPVLTGPVNITHRIVYGPAFFRRGLAIVADRLSARTRKLSTIVRTLETDFRALAKKRTQSNIKKNQSTFDLKDRPVRKQVEQLIEKTLKNQIKKVRPKQGAHLYMVRAGDVRRLRDNARSRARIALGFPETLRMVVGTPRTKSRPGGWDREAQIEMTYKKNSSAPAAPVEARDPRPLIRESVAEQFHEFSRGEFTNMVDRVYKALQRKLYIEKERKRY